MNDLAGRVIIVTGAASGIGRALVQSLRADGAVAIALDREALPGAGDTAFQMDVAHEPDWVRIVAAVVERHGRIDGLVNCAGIIRMAPLTATDIEDFRATMRVNVEGPFLGMKHVLPVMLAAGTGSVVNLSSTAGIAGAGGASAYCASKGAVRLMSKAAALEAIAAGGAVRVNSVHPAMTETPMVKTIVDQLGGDQAIEEQMRALQPSGQFIPVQGVVDGIRFLLSDASRYINGTEFVVDNGFTAQ